MFKKQEEKGAYCQIINEMRLNDQFFVIVNSARFLKKWLCTVSFYLCFNQDHFHFTQKWFLE